MLFVNEDERDAELLQALHRLRAAHEALDEYDVPRLNPTGGVRLSLVARIDYLAALREATVPDRGAA